MVSTADMLAPAAARKATFARRASHNAGCALGLSLIAGSLVPLLVCYPLLVAMMGLDVAVSQRFLKARAERKARMAVAFVAVSVAMIASYAAMALVGALIGGENGRLAAVFMAAGSLVTIIVLMVEAPLYMALSAAPCGLLIFLLPFLPVASSPTESALPVIGLLIIIGVFAHQLYRTGAHHVRLFQHNRAAREEAERRREEAERASRAKSEFLTTVTHELRTPLNAVINYAEMIEEDNDGDTAKDARRIARSAGHLLELINQILDFSALQDGAVHLSYSEVDLLTATREAVAGAEEMMRSNDNSAVVTCATREAMAYADRRALQQCMNCLVSNAAKFTSQGRVEIVIDRAGDLWRVTVADTGVGLPAEKLERVFEPFTQSDGTHTRRFGGLGLGLAAARASARLMGGDIVAVSKPGEGARFTFTVPAAPAPELVAAG